MPCEFRCSSESADSLRYADCVSQYMAPNYPMLIRVCWGRWGQMWPLARGGGGWGGAAWWEMKGSEEVCWGGGSGESEGEWGPNGGPTLWAHTSHPRATHSLNQRYLDQHQPSSSYILPVFILQTEQKEQIHPGAKTAPLELCSFPEPGLDMTASQRVRDIGQQLKNGCSKSSISRQLPQQAGSSPCPFVSCNYRVAARTGAAWLIG